MTIVCLVFFLLQMLLASRMSLGEIAPDFVLLLVSYIAVNRTPVQGALTGFFVGLFQDLFNPELLGLNALTKSLVGYGLGKGGSKADTGSSVFVFAIVALAAAAHDFLYLLFFTRLDLGRFFVMWITISLPSAIYTAAVGVIVHKLGRQVEKRAVRAFGKA